LHKIISFNNYTDELAKFKADLHKSNAEARDANKIDKMGAAYKADIKGVLIKAKGEC
jgi:hypothetical protein